MRDLSANAVGLVRVKTASFVTCKRCMIYYIRWCAARIFPIHDVLVQMHVSWMERYGLAHGCTELGR